jgi:hypothetical protein
MRNIKTKITIILGVAAMVLATITTSARAQTNVVSPGANTNSGPVAATNAPSIADGLTEIYNALANSGLATATNYAVEPYLTYAPNAPAGNCVGGGVLVLYNVSAFVGTGLGVDYLGQFSLVSANLTLRAPTHPLNFLGGSWTNVAVVPFVLAGVGTPLSGTSSGFAAITDAGGEVSFGHLWGGQFNTGVCYGRWDNAGDYTGARYHFFVGWSKGF